MIHLPKMHDSFELHGVLRAFEREEGARLWTPVGEFPNIVLNGFYNDLFQVMNGVSINMVINALALGYGVSPTFTRPDTALLSEWKNPVATLNAQLNNSTAYTTATITGLAATMPIGTVIQLAAAQSVTLTVQANPGATTITFSSFTTTQQYNVGTALNVTSWTPARSAVILFASNAADPPNATWSFYFPAINNSVALTFTEAGLLYKGSSVLAGGSPSYFATHAAFAYTKGANTDLRLDYQLARSLT